MAIKAISSIEICPINFKLFQIINQKTKNLEATLLFSKIKFHEIYSKIKKDGLRCIARSRKQMASWFNFSLNKMDRLLSILEENGLIKKQSGLWYGKKKLFIHTSEELAEAPIHMEMLDLLSAKTGSIKSALIFSRIAYSSAQTKITHEGLTWCCINKEELSSWSGMSIRTLDRIIERLKKNGFILKKNFVWKEKLQTHFHIPDFVIKTFKNDLKKPDTESALIKKKQGKTFKASAITKQVELETQTFLSHNSTFNLNKYNASSLSDKVIHNQNDRQQSAKIGASIRIRTKIKENNNTGLAKNRENESDIIFNTIGKRLTNRQELFLKSALDKTIERKRLNISSPKELWEEIKFWILNPEQHKGIVLFRHMVSRCMKILSDGNWRTPIGFYNHSVSGIEIKTYREKQVEQWEREKKQTTQSKTSYQTISFIEILTRNEEQKIHDSLTLAAIETAKKMVYLAQAYSDMKTPDPLTVKLMDDFTKQIEGFIRQGADREVVVNYLNAQT